MLNCIDFNLVDGLMRGQGKHNAVYEIPQYDDEAEEEVFKACIAPYLFQRCAVVFLAFASAEADAVSWKASVAHPCPRTHCRFAIVENGKFA